MTNQLSLTTERLKLRPFDISDAAVVQRLAGIQAVSDMTDAIPYPYEDGMAEAWISTHAGDWENSVGVAYAVCKETDDNLIGCVGLSISKQHNRASLWYWFGIDYWSNGYCTEAVDAVLTYAFETLKLNRIGAWHFMHNPASGAVMRKVGMQHEGTYRQYILKHGIFHDIEVYAILTNERA